MFPTLNYAIFINTTIQIILLYHTTYIVRTFKFAT